MSNLKPADRIILQHVGNIIAHGNSIESLLLTICASIINNMSDK